MFQLRSFATGLVTVLGLFFFAQGTHAATSTVCAASCDYTTLFDAVNADAPGPDGFLIMDGYVFDQGNEGGGNVTLPDDTFLTCEPNVTIGNGEGSIILNSGNNTTVDSCRFEGAILRAEAVTNVAWNNNTAITPARSEFHLFDITNFQVTNNDSFSHTRMFNADSGLFDGNDFQCKGPSDLNVACFFSFYDSIVPGNPAATTTDPAFVINDIIITNNQFTRVDNLAGIFFDFFGGDNLTISANEFISLTIQDASTYGIRLFDYTNADINHNTFDIHLPDNLPAGGSLAINLVGENFLTATVDHNTIIFRGVNSPTYNACFRIDKYGPPNPSDLVTFSHNICTATDSILENGFYIQDEVLTDMQFTEEYNAFYPVNDAFFIIGTGGTPADPTTHDDIRPIFRTENADPNDDYELNPASPLLDVNGSTDIGRFTGTRVSTYTVDDDCVVDYVACVSHFSENIEHFLKTGDSVLLAEGTFGTLDSHRALSNISIIGAGPLTILDAQSTATGINLSNADGFEIRDIKIINVETTGGASYTGTHILFNYNGNDYDDSDLIMGTPNLSLQFNETGGCVAGTTAADGDPYFVADGTNNIHGVLIDFGGVYLSGLTTSTAPTVCGGSPIEVRVDDLFIANGDGTYTYNPTALATAGVSLKAGITTPPEIQATITPDLTSGGLRLDNVMNSEFRDLVFEDTESAITLVGGSDNNEIHTIDLSLSNSAVNFTIDNSGDNAVFHSIFAVAKTTFSGTGTLTAWFENSIRVVDSLALPLAGVTVTKVSANGLEDTTQVTDGSGLTSAIDTLAFVLDSSNFTATGGGYNPYAITANRLGQNATTTINVNIVEAGEIELMMTTVPVIPPSVVSGGGAGGLPTVNNDGTYPPIESARSTEVITTPKLHYLVKLVDDNDPKTQEDSAVYYIGADDKRHAFPNQSVFDSWYCSNTEIKSIPQAYLMAHEIGSNVTYRPGLRMVKFIASPVVYVVQPGRTLRPIADEETAAKLFGTNWATQISDIEDTFYKDYVFGEVINTFVEPRHLDYTPKHPSGEMDIAGYKNITVQASIRECN